MTSVQMSDELKSAVIDAGKSLNSRDTIILGIGNKSRGDDGLGWAFLGALEKLHDFKAVMEYRYLLLVEDASLIADYENVIFVDASHSKVEGGFSFKRLMPGREFEFSTHIIPPESILYLTGELYDKHPKAYVMAIEGIQWGLGKGLTAEAKENLEKASAWFKEFVL